MAGKHYVCEDCEYQGDGPGDCAKCGKPLKEKEGEICEFCW